MHSKTILVIFCICLTTGDVIATPSSSGSRIKRQSPMEMVMNGVAVGVDMAQQGFAAGHAGQTSFGTVQNRNKFWSFLVEIKHEFALSTDTPLFGVSHSHDMKVGTGDALDAMTAREKRELTLSNRNVVAESTSSPWMSKRRQSINQVKTSMTFMSTNPDEYSRTKRETNEFPKQETDQFVESNMSKAKNFFNKFIDTFEELMAKLQRMVKSTETDGTVPTRAK